MRTLLVPVLLVAATQSADSKSMDEAAFYYPRAHSDRPLTLPAGTFEASRSLQFTLNDTVLGTPLTIAPRLSYGLVSKVTVGLSQQEALCLLGRIAAETHERGCPERLRPGLEAFARVSMRDSSDLRIAAEFSLGAAHFDSNYLYAKSRILLLTSAGNFTLSAKPSLQVGHERALSRSLIVPIQIALQAGPAVTAYVSTEGETNLERVGQSWRIPMGLGASIALGNALDVEVEYEEVVAAAGARGFAALRDNERLLQIHLSVRHFGLGEG